uniref:Uncharacterized protein n=1 Tax=viral metagenome TaxID=1070528 RepID=A0A6C0HU15_9ZZZZ
MRLISYDIGIKNLAYCVIEYEDKQLSIIDWNVMNLLEEAASSQKCSQINKIKGSKQPICQCIKDARFKKGEQYYCTKHAQKSGFIVPTKKQKRGFLKKMGNNELQQLAKTLFLFENLEKAKKDELVDKIMKYYEKQCLELVIEKKEKNAGEADLILIGKRMKKLLDENQITETITHVVIENQISPIATRMKTVQGMLTQYYIDRNIDMFIDFISSVNKLKQFLPSTDLKKKIKKPKLKNTIKLETKNEEMKENENTNDEKEEETEIGSKKDKTTYKDHKKSGIIYCSQIIENNPQFSNWKEKLETKKKDDLADCFLQGLWYFKQKNIISYADDLKINIV